MKNFLITIVTSKHRGVTESISLFLLKTFGLDIERGVGIDGSEFQISSLDIYMWLCFKLLRWHLRMQITQLLGEQKY